MDAAPPPPTEAAPSASTSAAPPAPVLPETPSIYGEWERQSEPYKGMRVVLRQDERTAVVTRASTVDPRARNKAQLECQRSLWKPGDVMVSDFDGGGGTMIVRDWGLTQGVCRHRDTKVRVDFVRADPDVLALSVWRGKTPVVQEWSRVAR